MKRPLENILVLDLTRVLAGPFATMILCDLGAEVIKVELPKTGDDARSYGPFINGESVYFMSLNRGKKSITLNLKTPRGREIIKKLVKRSDVLVENFRPGTLDKLGLGYQVLRKINPRLIYASCSGFGQTGPYREKPAYDIIVQGMGGIMSITGEPDGQPVRVGTSIGDIVAGLFTVIGILAALHVRKQTGLGQMVDVAMLDCQVAILENVIASYFASGEAPKPLGTRHPWITPFEAFKTKDNYVIVAAGNESLWARFCEAIGRVDLIEDPKFRVNALRCQNHKLLERMIEEITVKKTTDEWLRIFEERCIPCGPINTIDKVVKDPQVQARNIIVDICHPRVGTLKVAGLPINLSATQGLVENQPPLLGQHTHEVLKNLLGMSQEEIERLRMENVI